jgi:serine/threonine protein kinase
MGCNYSVALALCGGAGRGGGGSRPGTLPPGGSHAATATAAVDASAPDPLKEIPDTPDGVRGDYRLAEVIGKGSFGTVFRATHRRTGEAVAVKVMDRGKIKASSIYREYNVLEHLGHHPCVCAASAPVQGGRGVEWGWGWGWGAIDSAPGVS